MFGGLIDIKGFVRKLIHKLLVHEAQAWHLKLTEVEIRIRHRGGGDELWIYSLRDEKWLRELSGDKIEEILTK